MLRSLDYAAHTTLFGGTAAQIRAEDRAVLEPWASFWRAWASASLLRGYLEAARGAAFLPASHAEVRSLLHALLLEKSVYELGYELDNRPDWVRIPLRGIRQLLERR
jgi:maltose alpha-D-glucosyltransferase/alpha-amylase